MSIQIYNDECEPYFQRFHDLMKFRVHEVLLVSTPYDGFVLEEDGQLSERIFSEFVDLKIHYVPRIHRVSSAAEAFQSLENGKYDLVITMSRINDMEPYEFCQKVKEIDPDKPVVMLSYERLGSEMIEEIRKSRYIDRVFYWSGDSKILLAIIKYVEDMGNVEEDCKQGVQVILVIDDSAWYYSQFLPIIYTEIMKQTRYLVSYAVNEKHRLQRVRARPKILLAETYEEATQIINKYRNNLLGVIADVSFPKEGKMNATAGIELAAHVSREIEDLPFLLQSEDIENAQRARNVGIHFLNKNSQNLLLDLRAFILENYGFGGFLFKYPDGTPIRMAFAIEDLEEALKELPIESIIYHASNNHFSRWLRARTEFGIADELRGLSPTVFDNPEGIRKAILKAIERFYSRYSCGAILDFGFSKMDLENTVTKIGKGSLGGKARGIAFFGMLLNRSELVKKYPDIKIKTPRSFVVCSDVFEEFMETNNLYQIVIDCDDEDFITNKFRESKLPNEIIKNLETLLRHADYPLAVRSSSILEDSQILPFAGIYKTYILSNGSKELEQNLKQLEDAIKLIYASVFYNSPKQYARNADLRIEEEKMAVLIQQLVGEYHEDSYYPAVSGVAQSYNYYPYSNMKADEGIVSLALGFGKTIVEGGQVFRFSPYHPKNNPPYGSPKEFLKRSQLDFFALDINSSQNEISAQEECTYQRHDLQRAEKDDVIKYVCSTYSNENDAIMDTVYGPPGPRILTFAPILKHDLFPISDIVKDLFELGKYSFGSDVEIEFAVNIPVDETKDKEFFFLQVRPMVVGKEAGEVRIDDSKRDETFCASGHTIGNGLFKNIYDIIFVEPQKFELAETNKIAFEIGELNKLLYQEGRMCILMGFGRLGTSDPWLGIPLTWSQMSQAKVVIEADCEGLMAEPSLGSHFYHNLTSLKMGYFHIDKKHSKSEYIDWDWLNKFEVVSRTEHVKLIRSEHPFLVKIDGRVGKGAIMKPFEEC